MYLENVFQNVLLGGMIMDSDRSTSKFNTIDNKIIVKSANLGTHTHTQREGRREREGEREGREGGGGGRVRERVERRR